MIYVVLLQYSHLAKPPVLTGISKVQGIVRVQTLRTEIVIEALLRLH